MSENKDIQSFIFSLTVKNPTHTNIADTLQVYVDEPKEEAIKTATDKAAELGLKGQLDVKQIEMRNLAEETTFTYEATVTPEPEPATPAQDDEAPEPPNAA